MYSLRKRRGPTRSWDDFCLEAQAKARQFGQVIEGLHGVRNALNQIEGQLIESARKRLVQEMDFPKGRCDVRALLITWKNNYKPQTQGRNQNARMLSYQSPSDKSSHSFEEWEEWYDTVFLKYRGAADLEIGQEETLMTAGTAGNVGDGRRSSDVVSSGVTGGMGGMIGERGGAAPSSSSASLSRDLISGAGRGAGESISNNFNSLGFKPTEEQKTIVKYLLDAKKHVVVEAKPGPGKTATALLIASELRRRVELQGSGFNCRSDDVKNGEKVLPLVFNKILAKDTRDSVVRMGLEDYIDCSTFHAWFVTYLDRNAHDDAALAKVLKPSPSSDIQGPQRSHTLPVLQPLPVYDILICDECQDLNPLLFRGLMQQIIPRLEMRNAGLRLLLMGQREQKIYTFNSSDHRFFTLPDIAFQEVAGRSFVHLELSESFRLPQPVAKFINLALTKVPDYGEYEIDIEIMYKSWILSKKRSDYKPRYWVGDVLNGQRTVQELFYYIDELGISPGNIFILAPSVSKNSPAVELANSVDNTKRKKPIHFYKASRGKSIDPEGKESRGKVVISSFHQVKGLERDVVLLFGFDESYFQGHTETPTSLDPKKLPNPLYVGLTRSRKLLTIFHNKNYGLLPCFSPPIYNLLSDRNPAILHDVLKKLADFPEGQVVPKPRGDIFRNGKTPCCSLGSFCAHLPQIIINRCLKRLNMTQKTISSTSGFKNSILSRERDNRRLHGEQEMLSITNKTVQNQDCEDVSMINEIAFLLIIAEHDQSIKAPSTLKKALGILIEREGTMYLKEQITRFDWISDQDFERLRKTTKKLLDEVGLRPHHVAGYGGSVAGAGVAGLFLSGWERYGCNSNPTKSRLDVSVPKYSFCCASSTRTVSSLTDKRSYADRDFAIVSVSRFTKPTSEEFLQAAVCLEMHRRIGSQKVLGGAYILCPTSESIWSVEGKGIVRTTGSNNRGHTGRNQPEFRDDSLLALVSDLEKVKVDGVEGETLSFNLYCKDILDGKVV